MVKVEYKQINIYIFKMKVGQYKNSKVNKHSFREKGIHPNKQCIFYNSENVCNNIHCKFIHFKNPFRVKNTKRYFKNLKS